MSARKPLQGRTRSPLSDADAKRLDTFMLDIATALLPPSTPTRGSNGEVRFGRHGSLSIRADGRFFDHEAGAGGRGAVSLVRHLKADCGPPEAVAWVKQWLSANPGTGSMTIETAADTAAREKLNAEYARRALGEMVPIAGTAAEAYLVKERGLTAPWPDGLGYWPDARSNEGEGALVAQLTDKDGKTVAVHLVFLDRRGRKTTMPPAKQTFRLSSQATAGAVYRIDGTMPNPFTDPPADPAHTEHLHRTMIVTEGIEDALSAHLACPFSTIFGMAGVGQLKRLVGQVSNDVVVVRDGDHPDSGAEKSLVAGIDALLLTGGMSLRVTDTPLGTDANDLLRTQGADALRQLIIEAKPAQLSREGDIRRLARLAPLDVTVAEKKAVTKRWDISLRDLNQAVAAERTRAAAEAIPETGALAAPVWDETLWAEPVTDIGAVLDAALAEVKRYVVTSESNQATMCVWSQHTHLVHRDDLRLPITPRLAIQAAEKNCGKTTALDITRCMVLRPKPVVSATAASFFRVITRDKPTLLIDEADKAFRRGYGIDLLQLINGGHSRAFTTVDRVEEIDGQREVVSYDVWGAVAMAGIGRLTEATTQSRCVVVQMHRAKQDEQPEHMRRGRSAVLEETRQKFARWAADLKALPDILMPRELINRTGDNWEPLLQLARLAGPRWWKLILEAALADAASESSTEGTATPLLHDIRAVFGAKAQLRTEELCSGLLALPDPSGEWSRANRGGPVSPYYLRDKLRNLLDPPGAQQWKEGGRNARGYLIAQFKDSFERYLAREEQAHDQPHPPGPAKRAAKRRVRKQPISENGSGSDAIGETGNGVDEKYIFPTAKPSGTSGASGIPEIPTNFSLKSQGVKNLKSGPDGEIPSGTVCSPSGTAPGMAPGGSREEAPVPDEANLVPDQFLPIWDRRSQDTCPSQGQDPDVSDIPDEIGVGEFKKSRRLENGLDEAPEPNPQLPPQEEVLW